MSKKVQYEEIKEKFIWLIILKYGYEPGTQEKFNFSTLYRFD